MRRKRERTMYKNIKRVVAMGMLFCCLLSGCENPGKKVLKQSYIPNQTATTTDAEGYVLTDSTEITAMANTIVDRMSLEEQIGQMFIVNLEELDNTKGDYFEFRKCTDNMKESLQNYSVGGVILFSRNISTIQQTKNIIQNLQDSVKVPLFISVDEEGGTVARIGNNSNMCTTTFPPMEQVGKTEDESYAYTMGATIGKEIKELGFNLDFAPVADVKTNAYNTEIGSRSFGSDAKQVAKMVKQVVYGIQDQGISATLKHFPGHGSVSGDSHTEPVNADSDLLGLRKTEFKPFQAGIDAGVDFVMVSHISISKVTEDTVPASMSKLVLKNMLRKELGFHGVTITDALDMGAITKKYSAKTAAVNCVKAGEDMVLMTTDLPEAYQGVLEAVEAGEISEKQIHNSVVRIMEVKIKRGLILSNTDLLAPPENNSVEATADSQATESTEQTESTENSKGTDETESTENSKSTD